MIRGQKEWKSKKNWAWFVCLNSVHCTQYARVCVGSNKMEAEENENADALTVASMSRNERNEAKRGQSGFGIFFALFVWRKKCVPKWNPKLSWIACNHFENSPPTTTTTTYLLVFLCHCRCLFVSVCVHVLERFAFHPNVNVFISDWNLPLLADFCDAYTQLSQ